MKNKIHIAYLAVMVSAASTALAAVTNVAPSGVILQSSGSLNANFSAAHVIDGLTNEGPFEPAGYWLGPAGKAPGYFILDLMGEYPVLLDCLVQYAWRRHRGQRHGEFCRYRQRYGRRGHRQPRSLLPV